MPGKEVWRRHPLSPSLRSIWAIASSVDWFPRPRMADITWERFALERLSTTTLVPRPESWQQFDSLARSAQFGESGAGCYPE